MKLYTKQDGRLFKWETEETSPAAAIDAVRHELRDARARVLALITEKPAPTVLTIPSHCGDAA